MASVLVGDIGGTNARFALTGPDGRLNQLEAWRCADFPTLFDAVRTYLSQCAGRAPKRAAFAVAGAVVGDSIELTNSDWSFSRRSLQADLALDRLLVVNDAAALALAATVLPEDAVLPIGDGIPAHGPKVAAAPGTGFGVGAVVPADNGWLPVETEGGHAALPAGDEREAAVIGCLRRRFGHVSAERVLSGPGLSNLYAALADLDGERVDDVSSEYVTSHLASAHADPRCGETVALFGALLGSVAGDLALIYGARGGVYLAGGALAVLAAHLDWPALRRRFEAKGRFRAYLRTMPLYRVVHPQPVLVGLAALARGGA